MSIEILNFDELHLRVNRLCAQEGNVELVIWVTGAESDLSPLEKVSK